MVSLLLPIGSNEAVEEVRVVDRGEILTHGPATVLLSLLGSEYRVHSLTFFNARRGCILLCSIESKDALSLTSCLILYK